MNNAGRFCRHHNHWYDFGMTMHDNQLDREGLFNPWYPTLPYELAVEFPHSMASLESSLRVLWHGHYKHDHKNQGATMPGEAMKYSRSGGRGHMRLGGGSHSSSKTTRGKARAAARHGSGSRHSTKEKRWSRETIEALEREADRILGVSEPLEREYNFIPSQDREEYDDVYEVTAGEADYYSELFGTASQP